MAEESRLVEQFFKDLENPALYEKVDGVPVFDKSKRMKKIGDQWHEVEVTEADLKEIAAQANRLEYDRGSIAVISPGHRHRIPNQSEQDVPAIWGYARNFRPGTYKAPGGKDVPTLLSTWYLSRTEKANDGRPANEAARSYPFRSADYYGDTKEISGIALLKRDPELDLGLISFDRGGRQLFQYAMENSMPGMMPGANEPNPPQAPTAPPDARVDPNAGLSPEESAMADRFMRHYEKNHGPMKYCCDQYSASCGGGMGGGVGVSGSGPADGAGTPASTSATNTFLPGSKKQPDGYQRGNDPMSTPAITTPAPAATPATTPAPAAAVPSNEIAELRGQLAQYQKDSDARVAALTAELAAEREARGAAERSARLTAYEAEIKLLAETHSIDVTEQIEYTKEHTPEQFKKHMAMVAKLAPKAPIGRMPIEFARDGFEGTGRYVPGQRLGDEQQERVFQYLRENPSCDYELAVKKVLNPS